MEVQEWAGVISTLATTVRDGWRAGATALWAAGRRREAAWLRADHHAAAAVILSAASGRARDVAAAVRRCRAAAHHSAAHPILAAPWRDAAQLLAVAARLDQQTAALDDGVFTTGWEEQQLSPEARHDNWRPDPIRVWHASPAHHSGPARPTQTAVIST